MMSEVKSNGHKNRLSTGISIAKDIFALLRDASLFVVAFLLILFPSTFNAILTNAGFEEVRFAGLKWKRQFYDTDTALRTAQDTISSLQSQNTELLKAIADLEAGAGDVKQKEALANTGSIKFLIDQLGIALR